MFFQTKRVCLALELTLFALTLKLLSDNFTWKSLDFEPIGIKLLGQLPLRSRQPLHFLAGKILLNGCYMANPLYPAVFHHLP